MADKKISQLTALAAANLAPSTDVLAIVDTSATETKKIVAQDLINGVLNVASAVGIGTSSPQAKLHVANGTANNIEINGDYIQSFNRGGSPGYQTLTFYASNYVLNQGNLGLGVTPSAWTLFKVLQTTGASFAGYSASGNNQALIINNAFYDSSWKYINADYANYYRQYAGQHQWHNAAAWNGTGSNAISFTQAMTLDASGRLGVGVTSPDSMVEVNSSTAAYARFKVNYNGSALTYLGSFSGIVGSGNATDTMLASTGVLAFGAGGTTERGRFTAGGKFLVGTTSNAFDGNLLVYQATATNDTISIWNAATSGDNQFIEFYTEGDGTGRGSIDYNRAGGLVRYNTTSDYRAKDVYGLLDDSGETIDALKVYRGKMHGATMERPMLIAHEAQEVAPYAVTGEKDAVNEDGTPKFQQMDTSSLVPLLIAEIQSLRSRVAALEAK